MTVIDREIKDQNISTKYLFQLTLLEFVRPTTDSGYSCAKHIHFGCQVASFRSLAISNVKHIFAIFAAS